MTALSIALVGRGSVANDGTGDSARDGGLKLNRNARLLEALAKGVVISATTTAQPVSPTIGDLYIIPSGKTGTDWSAMTNGALALYAENDGANAWFEITPAEGWRMLARDTDLTYRHTGSAWTSDFGPVTKVIATGSTEGRSLADRFRYDMPSVLDDIPAALHAAILAGTSTTDVAGYIETSLAKGGPWHMPAGRYRIDSIIDHPGSARLVGDGIGRTLIQRSGAGGNIQAQGSRNTSQGNTLASNASAGATSVALSSGKGANFAAGDWALLIDETAIADTTQKQGEFVQVRSVSTDTINVMSPIQYSYTTAASAQLQKLTLLGGVEIEGVSFSNVTPTDSTSNLIGLLYCLRPRIINCEGFDSIRAALGLLGCVGAVADIVARDLLSDSGLNYLGYGANEIAANVGAQIRVTAHRVRHAYTTTGGATLAYGVATGSRVTGNCFGSEQAPWDTHAEAHGIVFHDIIANGSRHAGAQIRGKSCAIRGGHFERCIGPGIFITNDAQDTDISGVKLERTNCGTDNDGINWTDEGAIEDRGDRTTVNGYVIKNSGGPGVKIHADAHDWSFSNGRITDPCRVTSTTKEAFSAKATTTTTGEVDGLKVVCNDTRMDYGLRATSTNLDLLAQRVRSTGEQVAKIAINDAHFAWNNANLGPLNFGPQVGYTVASGVIDITNARSGVIAITGEGSVTDDLNTITGGRPGQTIKVRRAASHNIVLKHGTGNILCFGDADVTINSANDLFELTKVGSNWVMLRTS